MLEFIQQYVLAFTFFVVWANLGWVWGYFVFEGEDFFRIHPFWKMVFNPLNADHYPDRYGFVAQLLCIIFGAALLVFVWIIALVKFFIFGGLFRLFLK